MESLLSGTCAEGAIAHGKENNRDMSHRPQHENDKDSSHDIEVTGRYQEIPTKPRDLFKRPTFAAGAVLWRGNLHDLSSIEVAVIHRPAYDDWSLAKGKVDEGENLPTTAAREILEETGYQVVLGKLLGFVTYPVMKRTKVVYYWTGKVIGGEFIPNDEVDEIRWLSLDDARHILSYDVDRQVLNKAEKRFKLPATSRILLVRHAHAHARHTWEGNDDLRPLDKKGRAQAICLAPMLQTFHPTAIYSAEPTRCIDTATPLADSLGLMVRQERLLGDRGWLESMVLSQKRFMEIVNAGGVSVVVAQGQIIPELIGWLAARGRLPLDDIRAKKASCWVLSFNEGLLTGADYLESPLPLR